jgi:DNA damage-inducible protein 1
MAPEMVVGQVFMLYVPAEANGTALKAFVDSGAQMTIMSARCARECGVMRLLDTRCAGMAVGVGSQRILGRVHALSIKLGNAFLPCSVSVLEKDDEPSFIFGLDMLKRHQCCIDLRAGCLTVGTTGESVPFLSESELPRGKGPFGGDAADDFEELAGPSAPPPEPAAPGAAPPPAAAVPDAAAGAVGKLVELGFTAAQAAEALAACDGNAEQAAALLFSGGF